MAYFGRIKDGRVELDAPVELPEGARVRIEPISEPTEVDPVYRLGDLAVDDGGPPDVAAQHDHHIYGAPRRGDPADDLASEAIDIGLKDMSEEHDHHASGAPRRRPGP